MNWKEIDRVWKEFSSVNKLDLKVSDQNFIYGVKTTYQVVSKKQNLEISCQLTKNSNGFNRYRTKVISYNISGSNLPLLEISDKRKLGFIKNRYKDRRHNELLVALRNYNAKKLLITDDSIRVDYVFAFSGHSDFENAFTLQNKIKKLVTDKY